MPDFYEVLQVHPRAESEVIRAAYRVLARKYHPDHGGDAGRMIALNDAWDVLGDPERRAAYDASRLGSSGGSAAASATSAAASSGAATERRPAGATAATGSTAEAGASSRVDAMHAGPPPGNPSGTVLDFGRYAGWSLGEIARRDLVYLEWLARATVGRRLRAEIDALLRQRGAVPGGGATSRPWGHR
jgi:curved DNA-binding protein CbpA